MPTKEKNGLVLRILTKNHLHQCLHKFEYMQKWYSNRTYMHSYFSFAFNILLFFFFLSFTSLSLFLSCTSNSHLTLTMPLISTTLSPQPCHRWSPHSLKLLPTTVAIFFLCLMVLGFWLVVFDDFDQWFLMILSINLCWRNSSGVRYLTLPAY